MAGSPGVRRAEALDRILAPGILAGMVAAVAMGLLAVTAAVTWRHLAASTPLSEIAVLADPRFAGPATDQPVPKEPLVFAGAIQLLIGGLLGAAFGLLARATRLAGLLDRGARGAATCSSGSSSACGSWSDHGTWRGCRSVRRSVHRPRGRWPTDALKPS